MTTYEEEVDLAEYELDDGDDELRHIVCHDPNIALCGADVADNKWFSKYAPEDPRDCLVCHELEEYKCEVCGQR